MQKIVKMGTRLFSEGRTADRCKHSFRAGKRLLGTKQISVSLPEDTSRAVPVPREVPDMGQRAPVPLDVPG